MGEHDRMNDIISLTYHSNMAANINVFCMYAWAPPFEDDSKKMVILDKETQLGSLRTLEGRYGPHTVFIQNVTEFFRRLEKAVVHRDSLFFGARRGLVKYEVFDKLPTKLDQVMDSAFHKNPELAGENEYRITLMVDGEKPGPFRLQIGNIRDIAVKARTRDIYDSIAVDGSRDF